MERDLRIEEELFPFYALDALTDEERAEVERYLAERPEARSALDELSQAVVEMAAAAPLLNPNSAVKANLMARVEADLRAAEDVPPTADRPTPRPASAAQKAPTRPWWMFWATPAFGAMATLALIVAFVAVWQMAGQVGALQATVATLEAGAGVLQTQVDALGSENENLRRELAGRDDLLAQFTQPGVVSMSIGDITGENPDARAVLTVDHAAKAATLRVANLPPLPEGMTYQAWLIDGETPVSAGTFTVDERGVATHQIIDGLPGPFDAMGISVEPAGGSETPTPGNIILLGGSF